MPEKKTVERARKAKREGKAASTQAGEFIREEFHHVREGKHGARSPEQVIAIGLSKARKAGVKLRPPKKGTVSEETRHNAERAYRQGQSERKRKVSSKRSRATTEALKHEGKRAASHEAISRQAKRVAKTRTARERSEIARRATRSLTAEERSAHSRKAARTRARKQS